VNRPGRRRPGTVGEPLPGIRLGFDGGEIRVSAPTVMEGYKGQGPATDPWPTGDLGDLDADGFLRIRGRKDDVIVLGSGRNVSPEWVETAFAGDPRIERAVLVGHGRNWPVLLVWPSIAGRSWFATAEPDDLQDLIATAGESLPAYARPGAILVVEPALRHRDGLFAGGKPRRQAIAEAFSDDIDRLYRHSRLRRTTHDVL
jgi:acyl-CoA synthetase (AMP-forming)/AMP-acid ligase II